MEKRLIITGIVLFFLISCGGSASEDANFVGSDAAGFKSREALPVTEPGQELQNTSNTKEETLEKKIIKTANVTVEVKSFTKARAQLEPLLKKFQAYISNEKQNNSDYELNTTILIRLKSENFDSLLNEICGMAYKISSKEVHTEDVTEEFIDITIRLKNKKQVELQYLELLKKANTIDEILNVNEHLRIIREEIESKEGRLKYLENQVSYSTINLYMYERTEQAYRGFGEKLIEGLEGGWKGILGFIIGITYLWPLIIIIIVVSWFIIRYRKKRKILKN
jgi:hypothetical protein